jgi:hypothetical protein
MIWGEPTEICEDGQSQGQDMNLRPTEYEVFVTDAQSYRELWDKFCRFEEAYPSVFLLTSVYYRLEEIDRKRIILLIRNNYLWKGGAEFSCLAYRVSVQ